MVAITSEIAPLKYSAPKEKEIEVDCMYSREANTFALTKYGAYSVFPNDYYFLFRSDEFHYILI